MTNIVHTGVWEGPCRWKSVSVEDEAKYAETSFANWSKQLKEKGLGRPGDVELLEPAHITFSEKFVISDAQWAKLAADSDQTDAYFVYPSGSSVSAYEIAARFGKPILLKGLGCRNVDIAAYTKAKGSEAFVAADEAEFNPDDLAAARQEGLSGDSRAVPDRPRLARRLLGGQHLGRAGPRKAAGRRA